MLRLDINIVWTILNLLIIFAIVKIFLIKPIHKILDARQAEIDKQYADAKAAQMFTIIHELAHVWLGKSAGFDNANLLPADDPLELLCDKVAAELLVPEIYFIKKWETSQNFNYLSRIFKVSPIVIGRRALDLKLITFPRFMQFYNEYMNEIKERKDRQSSGGDFYATTKKRISLRFAAFVNNAVKENKLLYRDAYKLTNMKGETYNKFIIIQN